MSEPWLERWREGRIGWHEPGGNANLRAHWTGSSGRVLVPLCGKTIDLLWLEDRGHDVVGVELSPIAARDFFEENGIDFSVRNGPMPEYVARDRRIAIHCADIFRFDAGPFAACYDRGALVALPRDLRAAYARKIDELLAPGATRLLITVEYDQGVVDGPPYSVGADEVGAYWPSLREVSRREDIANGPPKFREAGLDSMAEVAWR